MEQNDNRESMADFVKRVGLVFDAEPISKRSGGSEWDKDASHWKVLIGNPRGFTMSVEYSMGSGSRRWKVNPPRFIADWTEHDKKRFGYTRGERVSYEFLRQSSAWAERMRKELTEPIPPLCADVVSCLVLDASTYDNAASFSDWCRELGMNVDSIKDKRTYDLVGEQSKQLRHLLGSEYENALYNVEPS